MAAGGNFSHLQKQEQRITSSLIQGLNMLSLPTQAMYDYLVELSMAHAGDPRAAPAGPL